MSNSKIYLTLKLESSTEQQKAKNLDFSIKLILKKIPGNVSELESEFLDKGASEVLEGSLRDIIIHNDNINEYAKMYRGDPESELNKKHLIRDLFFSLDAGTISTKGKISIKDGSFKSKVSAREILESLMAKIEFSEKPIEC